MYLLELFCGTKSISKEFEKLGFKTITVDIDARHNPDIISDIRDLEINQLGYPNVIWASPPCTHFSVASIGRNWHHDGTPKTDGAKEALKLISKTLEIIDTLEPTFWFMENPRGKLRKLPIVAGLPMETTTYCQYGDSRMKPTDIWTNSGWIPKQRCRNGDKCHDSAPRGSKKGTQGIKGAIDRAIIPPELCAEIAKYCFDRL